MSFRVILSFIVITFISYLFSKDKTPAKPTINTNEPVSRDLQSPIDKIPDTDKNQKRGLSSGLEDLFKEIKTEFEKNLVEKKTEEKQSHSTIEQDAKKENNTEIGDKTHLSKRAFAKDVKKVAGSVYEGEIGKEKIYIKFDKESIIKGIIMSEVLQKPKGLKR